MERVAFRFVLISLLFAVASCKTSEYPTRSGDQFLPLFDGQSLAGWEGDDRVFQVANGAIVAGALDRSIPRSEHLCTDTGYDNFILYVSARIEGNPRGGVYFRSDRLYNSNYVGGYKAEMGIVPIEWLPLRTNHKFAPVTTHYPVWGSLLDERRPYASRYSDPALPFWLLAIADSGDVYPALRRNDWNTIVVAAAGPHIEISLNGIRMIEYTEQQKVAPAGRICLQLHKGPASRVSYKDIKIKPLN